MKVEKFFRLFDEVCEEWRRIDEIGTLLGQLLPSLSIAELLRIEEHLEHVSRSAVSDYYWPRFKMLHACVKGLRQEREQIKSTSIIVVSGARPTA